MEITNRDIAHSLRSIFKGEHGFYEFVIFFWETIIAEPLVDNWHIKYLCDELQGIGERVARREAKEYDYYIINVSPGSSKSTIVSEMYPIWCWTIDPTQRFICGSYASTPAEDIASKSFKIYTSDLFQKLYPELVKSRSGGMSNFKNGLLGERYTTSTGSGITGIHAHQIILDDPMNPQIAASELERTRANKWVSETISSRKVDKAITPTIIVMQRLHELDTTGYLLSKKNLNIRHICLPAELSEDVKPIELKDKYIDGLFDVKRLPLSVLQSIREDLGSYGYAGQMMQRPTPIGGGIIKKEWLQITTNAKPSDAIIHFQVDTAYTSNTDNDPTAIVGYYVYQNQIFITSVISVYKEFPDFVSWLPTYLKENGYSVRSKIYTEPKATGLSVVQTVKRMTTLNILTSAAPKDDKLTRVHIVSPKIESGRITLQFGGWNDSFLHQCESFPNGRHDDELDCMVAIIMRELMKPKNNIDLSKLNLF